MSPRPVTRRAPAALAAALLLGTLASAWAVSGHGMEDYPVSRTVLVTDSRCGAHLEPADDTDAGRHAAVLRCIARGAHVVLYERSKDRLYEVEFASPGSDLIVKLTNEFAGREATVKGHWDEQKLRVLVQDVLPAPPHGSDEVEPARRKD